MKIKADLVLREIAGDWVLVPTGETVVKYNGLFSLTETGARIWELIPECGSEEEIADRLFEEFDCEREVLARDVKDFLEKLREMDFID